ncbi:MAG: adenine phosphoribosyltransferase [Bacilli bacterium]
MNYKKYIESIPDFPVKGILFRDITPLLSNGKAFDSACTDLAAFAKEKNADVVAGPESRGFIFGCPIATKLGIGFVPIRKPNKLPRESITKTYQLEYGSNSLCVHVDAIRKGQKVVIVDDLLATGGTVKAAVELIEELGGIVVGIACLIELTDLNGRNIVKDIPIKALISY